MLSKEEIIVLIRKRIAGSATMRELLQALRIKSTQRESFRGRIKSLVSTGKLIKIKGNRYSLANRKRFIGNKNTAVGRFEANLKGFGFVILETALEGVVGDIYVSGENLNHAMHGDQVVVQINRREGSRTAGSITRVLKRATSFVVGCYELSKSGFGVIVPLDRRLSIDLRILKKESKGARSGEIVEVEITKWSTTTGTARGRVVEVIGDIDTPGIDVQVILRKYGLSSDHSKQAIDEANRLSSTVSAEDICDRKDFRSLQTVTIDGETARDFDDAVTIQPLANGNYWLGVHIADVSHYVPEESALDVEAFNRSTSTYFPDRAIHMFPEVLATGICSLNPEVDRLVQSCFMEIGKDGEVVKYEMHDGVIRSNARMTYTEVNAVLTKNDKRLAVKYEKFIPLFKSMVSAFHLLNARRRQRGSIDFKFQETKLVIGENGSIEKIVAAERNIAHQIIEEFMLVANETVARHLEANKIPSLYRVHESPNSFKVEEFQGFVSTFGYCLTKSETDFKPLDFQKLIDHFRGKPEEKAISLLILRTMQKARYAVDNLEHFGLAMPIYTHFTSPIRRYPDLMVHRVLKMFRISRPDENGIRLLSDHLKKIARHASDKECQSEDAERELVQWKKVRFMVDKVGEEFKGCIISVTRFGLFIELAEHFVEGLVHISTMNDDYYELVDRAQMLSGKTTGRTYRLGDEVKVQVLRVDTEDRQIELGLIDILESGRSTKQNRQKRQKKVRSNVKRTSHFRGDHSNFQKKSTSKNIKRSRSVSSNSKASNRKR